MYAVAPMIRLRKIFRSFEQQGAMTPETAMYKEELKIRSGRMFTKLLRQGVIQSLGDGRYYLAADMRDLYLKTLRRRMISVFFIVVLIVVYVYLTSGR